MNRIEKVLRDAAAALTAGRTPFALVGGLAVSARTEPRFTRDVDMAVAVPGDPAAEQFVHDFVALGYSVLATVEQDATGRLATVRLLPPGEEPRGIVLDFLFASSGVEPELVHAADPIEVVAGLTLPVASIGHLMALKILSHDQHRPQDLADLRALAAAASAADLQVARRALTLIDERGFHRGKKLQADLEGLLHNASG